MQKKKLTKKKKKVEIKGSKGKDENVENRTDIKRIASQAVKKRMTFKWRNCEESFKCRRLKDDGCYANVKVGPAESLFRQLSQDFCS